MAPPLFSPQLDTWRPAPAGLELAPGEAHVIRLRLDPPPARQAALRGLLSVEEQARADRLRGADNQRHWTAARGQLREVLGQILHRAPEGLVFQANLHGKPALAEGNLHFNLSHSGEVGLLALALQLEVGVDIERVQPERDWPNIARRFFAPAEQAELFGLPAEMQPLAFTLGWARKEAYIKARGLGLSIALDQFVVTLDPAQPARLVTPGPGVAPGQDWEIYGLEAGEGFAAALAAAGRLERIATWDWPGQP